MHVDEDVGEYHVDMVYSAYIDDVEKQYYLLKWNYVKDYIEKYLKTKCQ